MATATSTRHTKGTLIPAQASSATGTLEFLPSGALEVVEPAPQEPTAPAAMPDVGGAGPVGSVAPALADIFASAMGSGANSGSSPREGDPDVAYAFKLSIGNVTYAMFSEVGGLSWKAEAIPVRSGGNNEHSYNMRGPGKFEPLTLKRGWFASTGEFYVMMKASLSGNNKNTGKAGADRSNLTITVMNRKYQPIGEYNIYNAFITEYSGLQLNSMSSAIGFEQVRMAYDYFVYKKSS